jgi:spore maturation protein CgeB
MLSIGNRDLHTHRSVEIPSLGSVLCAERTTEHLQLYSEGAEAVFWNDADECAKICAALLKDDERRKQIAELGHARCLANGHFTEPLLAKVIDASFS